MTGDVRLFGGENEAGFRGDERQEEVELEGLFSTELNWLGRFNFTANKAVMISATASAKRTCTGVA